MRWKMYNIKNSWNRRSKEEIANIHQHWTANKSLIISHIFTQKCKYTHYLVGNYWEKKIVKKHALRKWNGKSSTYWNISSLKMSKKKLFLIKKKFLSHRVSQILSKFQFWFPNFSKFWWFSVANYGSKNKSW